MTWLTGVGRIKEHDAALAPPAVLPAPPVLALAPPAPLVEQSSSHNLLRCLKYASTTSACPAADGRGCTTGNSVLPWVFY